MVLHLRDREGTVPRQLPAAPRGTVPGSPPDTGQSAIHNYISPANPDYYTHYYKNTCLECARNYHIYTHLILALGIVREPTV